MKFNYRDTWCIVDEPSDSTLFLRKEGVGVASVELDGADLSLETDLHPLYKKDKQGRWQVMMHSLVIQNGTPCIYKTIQTPGLKTKEYTSPIKPVNNKQYSDVVQQRLQAAWTKKKDRDGWVIDKDEVVLGEPMLLHHWDEYKEHMKYPAIMSPKMDGIRATFKPGMGLMSRKRNPFDIPHIKAQLDILGMTTDGELWHPEWNLEKVVSCVKKSANDPENKLEYHIFDRPQGGKYVERLGNLMKVMSDKYLPNVKVVPVVVVQNEMDALAYFEVLKKTPNCDGAIIRTMDGDYEFNTRSREVLKIKDIIQAEFTVTDVIHDVDKIGHLIKFEFECDAGKFLYSPAWSKEKRAEEFNKHTLGEIDYVGKVYTLTFREYTNKGIPKFIIDLQERDYE